MAVEETSQQTATVTDLASYQQFAQEQQAANNAWSAQQAQKQMDFQERMSNTAHQREVADLKAAGLNPVLSANSGASVPNGASGEADTSTAGNVGAILQQVLSAQSAREVAAMYNAATINAASIAANASMYGADMAYKAKSDNPGSFQAMLANGLASGKVNGFGQWIDNVFGDTKLGSWASGMSQVLGKGLMTTFKVILKGIGQQNPNLAYTIMQRATQFANGQLKDARYKKLPPSGTIWRNLMQFLGL